MPQGGGHGAAVMDGTPGTRAQRAQPQTTVEPAGGPFIRHSRRSRRPGYSVNSGYGQTIDQPLPGAPGYLAYYDVNFNANAGANATTNSVSYNSSGSAGNDFSGIGLTGVTTAARSAVGNSVAAAVQFVQVQDAHGTVVFSGNGWEMLYAWPLISGQVGVLAAADLNKWPSATASGAAALGTGTATTHTGNYFYHSRIPFEIVPGYGLLGIGNQALQPRIHLQMQASAAIYTLGPLTAPVVTVSVDEGFYGVPQEAPGLRPLGLGTTLQAIQVTANPTVGSASSNRIQIARLGGWLTGLMLVARDSTGNRNDNVWPAFGSNQRIRLYLDSVPILDEMIEERFDAMYEQWGGLFGSSNVLAVGLPPAGVIFYTWRDFESQANLGRLDNGEGWINTNPGTLLEVECTPWGTFSGGPAQITAVLGMIVPRGSVVQGQTAFQ